MKHIISVLVENKFGVLARIAGLFSARGYNITSLSVGETHDPDTSCMTIVVDASDEKILDQIKKQLNRLIDVINVTDLTKKDFLEKELVLVKTGINSKNKEKLKQFAKKYKASFLEARPGYAVLAIAASEDKISGFLDGLKSFGINELVRTGRIAIVK